MDVERVENFSREERSDIGGCYAMECSCTGMHKDGSVWGVGFEGGVVCDRGSVGGIGLIGNCYCSEDMRHFGLMEGDLQNFIVACQSG